MLFYSGLAAAQPLSAFLQEAGQQNLDARLGAEARARASAELGQAWGALLPALTASGGWTHNQYDAVISIPDGPTSSKSVTIVPKDQLDATLKVEVPLLDPAKWLRTAAAGASDDAAAQRERSSLDGARRQVVNAFYAWSAAQAVLDSARRSLEVARAQLDVTDARTKAGVANELELERAKAEVERSNQLVADAEALLAKSARSLETLSGLSPTATAPLPDDDLHPEPALAELEPRTGELPQVQAAARDADAASRTWTAATLVLVPTVNAQFTQRFTNATGFQGASAAYNAGLTFNWRLDAVGVHGIRAQASAEATARLNAEKARLAARDQLHADWQNARAAITKVRAARAQATAARRASSLAHERYGAGVATQLDVIQSERDVFAAEVSEIQARAELASARASLRLSAGLPLEGATP